MNLRISLILITLFSWVAIGATFIVDSGIGNEKKEPEPPFFYTLPVDDLRHIVIETGGQTQGFTLHEDTHRWFIDGMTDVPADLYRWGGITTLLGGPRTQRVLDQAITDPAQYGLDNPTSRYTVTLRDGTERVMLIGTQTPNGQSTYAQIEGLDKLVLVDSSWSSVLNRLVTEPPVPEWLYTLNPDQVSEMLLFENNDVVRGYGLDRSTGEFHLCDVPVIDQPCAGSTPVDKDAFEAALGLVADRHVEGVVALDLAEEPDFAAYGTGRNSPYFAISYEQKNDNGVTEVRRVTMSIGDVTPDGAGRYAVANETSDVIRIDKEWGDKLLELFHGPALVAPGATPTTPTATPAP